MILGTLYNDLARSRAYAINNSGQIVGNSQNGNGDLHGFLYIGGTMFDLNDLVINDAGFSEIRVNGGSAIVPGRCLNDAGQIAAVGLLGDKTHALLLTPVVLTGHAVSRKSHGSGVFDIDLPGIECRTGGPTNDHQVVVTFAAPVAVNGSPQAQVTSGTGDVGTGGVANGGGVSISGAVVTVPLTNIANAQTIVVTLFGVSDGINTTNLNIPMGVLLGDVNGSARVDSGDVSVVRQQTFQTITSSNFREDINVSNRIDSGDVSIVRQQTLTSLP